MANEQEPIEAEIISVGGSLQNTLQQITSAEIDMQIATAHQFPRQLTSFKSRAIGLATLDEETAESCIYSRPVGKGPDGKQKYVEGMSIRMAEIVAASYGNIRVGSTLLEMTDRFVKARGYAHDLETNFASSCEVVESTVDSHGRPYSERMRVVVAKAALAKARRDATFQVVPKALCKPVEAAARKLAIGEGDSVTKRRQRVVGWVNALGIDPARVWAAIGIAGPDDLTEAHLVTLTGIRTALKEEGGPTLDDAFPPLATPQSESVKKAADAVKGAADKSKSKGKASGEKEQPKPAEPSATPSGKTDAGDPRKDALEAMREAVSKAADVETLDKLRKDVNGYHDDGLFNDSDLNDMKDLILGKVALLMSEKGGAA